MSTASRPLAALPAPVKRLLALAGAVTCFIALSAVLNPDRSLAQARMDVDRAQQLRAGGAPGAQNSQPATVTDQTTLPEAEAIRSTIATSRPLIGTLTGSPYYIWVYAGRTGPVYTVANKQGRILAQELTADELYAQLPEVAVDQLHLQPGDGKAVMMVDPGKQ
jgi:hypothetical protein